MQNILDCAVGFYLYIHTYERLLSFAGGRFTASAIQNGKMTLSKKARNSKRPFFEASWLVQPGQTLWNKCVFWCDWKCSSATVISVLLQSSQHWHYPRLSVQCCSIENLKSLVFGRIASFKHASPTHVCFVLAKPTFGTVVYMCKERYHPIPTPPQPTSLWSLANDNDFVYTYILWSYFIFVCYYVCLRVSNCLVWTLNLNIEEC